MEACKTLAKKGKPLEIVPGPKGVRIFIVIEKSITDHE